MEPKHIKPASAAAQALGWVDEKTRAVSPPLHTATTYLRDPDNQYRSGRGYIRADNPAFDQAEALLNHLEGGAGAMLFSSGMAAATSVFLALKPGDHVVAPKVIYWGLRNWLQGFAQDWGLQVELVDMTDLAALNRALQPGRTKLVWIETPANPTWVITDIAATAELAHRAGARLAVDSTVATPVLTQPLALGADVVMHAATKYLNGHSDVLAGALVTARDDEFWQRLKAIRHDLGAVVGSFEAWLLLRGMRTLFVRVNTACRNAQQIAEHFAGHPRIEAVLYPGRPTAQGHAIAARQMTGGFGGMLSLRIKGGEAAAIATAARVQLWKRATSLGGVESLIEHRASIEGAGSPAPVDMLRLSTGIEDAGDLIADLEQALAKS
ncbi:MAG: PLP-dependent aspartate aminotransferase family protein [bacterium]|nr:PLP-dependent aspartate aminotransferase family protein [bacterium]MDI1335512.1 PLP-dependent aspartate aminotransferase family protein [Lacunisphaera sp.]